MDRHKNHILVVTGTLYDIPVYTMHERVYLGTISLRAWYVLTEDLEKMCTTLGLEPVITCRLLGSLDHCITGVGAGCWFCLVKAFLFLNRGCTMCTLPGSWCQTSGVGPAAPPPPLPWYLAGNDVASQGLLVYLDFPEA
jgi:hypothetical protein